MSKRTFHISTSCQNIRCSEEMSFPIDMLRWWKNKPICKECFEELPYADRSEPGIAIEDDDGLIDWSDLAPLLFGEAQP